MRLCTVITLTEGSNRRAVLPCLSVGAWPVAQWSRSVSRANEDQCAGERASTGAALDP